MKVDEKAAKQKWCPFTRVAVHTGNAGAAVNRYPTESDILDETRCIGSECMAWAWLDSKDAGLHRRGFCGLVEKE